ncbi:MAG TPA: peptidylprolyl isomerase [Gemmatimonadaceae bacterium]|nr:peptidylprolyl isomerase [Gemmatimonadaceae bacterium]
MTHRRLLVALLALAPALVRAQDAALATRGSASAGEIPVERIVAVVGSHAILWSDVIEIINQRRAQGMQVPTDSTAQAVLARQVVEDLIDEELLIQRAQGDTSIKVSDQDVSSSVDRQYRKVREQFKSDAEMRTALQQAGFGTPEEYRRSLTEQFRRRQLQERVIEKFRQTGKLVPVAVSEAEITEAFEKNRGQLPRRPATVAFRQVVITPKPSEPAKRAALARAESLAAELRRGGDFEQVAKRASDDQSNRETGGDLGWNRRGVMVPEFERWMFALAPGQVSPVVETVFGYHIIRVDRVQPAEVKSRHILVRPKVDSSDIARARAEADSVVAQWRRGATFDTLALRYHDPSEDRVVPEPIDRSQLPEPYQAPLAGKKATDIVDPFTLPDPATGNPKFVIVQVTEAHEAGDFTVADLRETIRSQLQQERSFRRLLDSLRRQTHVSIRM